MPTSPKRTVPAKRAVAAESAGRISPSPEITVPEPEPTPKQPKIPPIVVPQCSDWHTLLRELKQVVPSGRIEAKSQGSSIRLLPKSIQDFRACQKFLADSGRAFHTVSLPEERELKIVVSGIPDDTPILWIWKDLAEKGFFPTSVVSLLSGDRKRKINSFYIRIQKVGSFADVYQLETILCLRVQVRACLLYTSRCV